MTVRNNRVLADCSTVVKWKLTSEAHSAHANEILLDWEHGNVEVCIPDQLLVELVGAMLGTVRKNPPRLTEVEAKNILHELLDLPFIVYRTRSKRILTSAFEIARQFNLRAYDCVYVAMAERKRIDFWTSDQRLYNALHGRFSFVRWIADYQPGRPIP
jgi:predicted nucleic acid-binding protein